MATICLGGHWQSSYYGFPSSSSKGMPLSTYIALFLLFSSSNTKGRYSTKSNIHIKNNTSCAVMSINRAEITKQHHLKDRQIIGETRKLTNRRNTVQNIQWDPKPFAIPFPLYSLPPSTVLISAMK